MITCLTGMHRSGTSLMSSYLQKCGINMGDRLVGAMRGNPRGHFEDEDFVRFHDAILADNRCHMYNPKPRLVISPEYRSLAEKMIDRRRHAYTHFGWKDPRTTLFLDFWADILPECKFVFLYRDPWVVVDSLRRRRSDRRVLVMPWLPAVAWLKYNYALMDFYANNMDKCVLININGFNANHELSRQYLGRFLDYSLDIPYTDVYHENEIQKRPPMQKKLLFQLTDNLYKRKLTKLYHILESAADINLSGPACHS